MLRKTSYFEKQIKLFSPAKQVDLKTTRKDLPEEGEFASTPTPTPPKSSQ